MRVQVLRMRFLASAFSGLARVVCACFGSGEDGARAVGPPLFVFTSDVMLRCKVSMLADPCVFEPVQKRVWVRVDVAFFFFCSGLL